MTVYRSMASAAEARDSFARIIARQVVAGIPVARWLVRDFDEADRASSPVQEKETAAVYETAAESTPTKGIGT